MSIRDLVPGTFHRFMQKHSNERRVVKSGHRRMTPWSLSPVDWAAPRKES